MRVNAYDTVEHSYAAYCFHEMADGGAQKLDLQTQLPYNS